MHGVDVEAALEEGASEAPAKHDVVVDEEDVQALCSHGTERIA